jgi:hypothetical protein
MTDVKKTVRRKRAMPNLSRGNGRGPMSRETKLAREQASLQRAQQGLSRWERKLRLAMGKVQRKRLDVRRRLKRLDTLLASAS